MAWVQSRNVPVPVYDKLWSEMRVLVFLGLRYVRFALAMRYLPRLLDALFTKRIPHRWVRRPIMWWLVRRLLR
jgi:hypothetical protein